MSIACLSACTQAEETAPPQQTDFETKPVSKNIEAQTLEQAPTVDLNYIDSDAPENNTLPLEKLISPAERAYLDMLAMFEPDPRLQPIAEICGEPDGPYYPDYLLDRVGYEKGYVSPNTGSIYFGVASYSRGNIATESYYIPTETLIIEALNHEIRVRSGQDNVSGATGGFRSNGESEETYTFEEVQIDRKIHCNEPEKAVQMLTDFISGLSTPATMASTEIRYSVDIRSEVNLEGMCEYQREEAKAEIAETLKRLDLVPMAQLAVAPNNDMRIKLTPMPNTQDVAQNECRYHVEIIRNWTTEPWYPTAARNQAYETGYELITDSLSDVGKEFKALQDK